MKEYNVEITLTAQKDINEYVHFIKNEYKSPMTSEKHLIGLFEEIQSLKYYAESIQVSTKDRVLKYGTNARSLKYKKMCIIYTVHNLKVIVHELLPCSMVISETITNIHHSE